MVFSGSKTGPRGANLFLVIGLDWVGLGWMGLGWLGLDWMGLGWVDLGWMDLGWVDLDLDWVEYNRNSADAPPAPPHFNVKRKFGSGVFRFRVNIEMRGGGGGRCALRL